MTFQRFEIDDTPSLEDVNMGVITICEENDFGTQGTDPETVVVLRSRNVAADGIRNWSAIVYYGATVPEITQDLNSREV